jgi:hypothetical protein
LYRNSSPHNPGDQKKVRGTIAAHSDKGYKMVVAIDRQCR